MANKPLGDDMIRTQRLNRIRQKKVDPGRFNRRKRNKSEKRGRKNLGDLAVASSGSKKTQGASGSR